MTLNQQFLIVSILPLSFLLMALFTWRSDSRRRFVYSRWLITLILGAVWASSSVRFFTTTFIDRLARFNWGIVGTYAFTLTIIGILITTFSQINTPKSENRITLTLSTILAIGAFVLDPRIWELLPNGIVVSDQQINQFYLWSGVWVASWLIPLLAALILTQRTYTGLPQSLFRNLLDYWRLMLILFLVGGIFNSINQANQPGWQQLGVLFSIVAAAIGTYSITRSQLPDLPLATRQLISRLSGTFIIFGLTLFALSYLVYFIENLPPNLSTSSRNLVFFLAAGLFAAGFTIFYQVITNVTRRIFLPAEARRQVVMSDYANAVGNLPEPEQLGRLFLRIVQSNFGTDDAWFFETSDGPQGRLILRPLASISDNIPDETIDFDFNSPITRFLRQNKSPLVQYDIDTLEDFTAVTQQSRDILTRWQRILFMPMHAGDSLIGVIAFGEKRSGESYTRADYVSLSQFGEQASPLLAQAQNLASLQKINKYVFKQNQILSREKRHLKELVALYGKFVNLVSPELTKPFAEAGKLTLEIERANESADVQPALVNELGRQLDDLKRPIDNLVSLATRIGSRQSIHFEAVQFNDIVETAVRQLDKMASARRVKVEFESDPTLPLVLGDHEQLREAVRHLLHNAIKFNKIGGVVQLTCSIERGNLLFKVVDTGVGIPEERLEKLWNGLAMVNKNGNGRGTGLGLSLTNFIVSAHGGEIKAQSKYGSGTVFALTLPLLVEEQSI